MQTNDKKIVYSVYSGIFFEFPEKDIKHLDAGHIPLTKNSTKNCKKCYGRGHIGKDQNTLAYQICKCIRKNIDFELIKSLLPDKNILS